MIAQSIVRAQHRRSVALRFFAATCSVARWLNDRAGFWGVPERTRNCAAAHSIGWPKSRHSCRSGIPSSEDRLPRAQPRRDYYRPALPSSSLSQSGGRMGLPAGSVIACTV